MRKKNKKSKKNVAFEELVFKKLVSPVSYKIFTTILAICFLLSTGLLINAMLAEELAPGYATPPVVNSR